jgi:hypothetical protein
VGKHSVIQTKGNNVMALSKFLSIALMAGAGVWSSAALAQSLPGSVQIGQGIWTTPEISAKCQAYVAKRVPLAGADQQRQSLMAACVKKAYAQEVSKQRKKG